MYAVPKSRIQENHLGAIDTLVHHKYAQNILFIVFLHMRIQGGTRDHIPCDQETRFVLPVCCPFALRVYLENIIKM